jgi:single-strand DNA-binding protein
MYQKTIILGNLGGTPQAKALQDGTSVTTFSVAVNERGKGGEKSTAWFRVSVFGKQADACLQYLDKGSAVLVEGRLLFDKETGSPRVWGDGEKRASFELLANQVTFVSTSSEHKQTEEDGDW